MGQTYLVVISLAIYYVNAYVSMGYLGCYEDTLDRILDIKLRNSDSNSGGECKLRCSSREYRYAGTENQEECYCGFRLKNYPMRSGCNMTCPGYEKEYCGGHMRISIYDTWQMPTHSYIAVTTTFANSTVQKEQNELSTVGLDQDTGNNSSLVVAYVLAPVGCLVVFVSVLVIVIRKRRKGKDKVERQINVIQNHMYSEVGDIGASSVSLKATSLESNEYENSTFTRREPPTPESIRSSAEEHITGGLNERNQDAMYITPIYTLENEYMYIDPVSVHLQINMDGQYEMLRRNNLCENEYKSLRVNTVNPTYDYSKQL